MKPTKNSLVLYKRSPAHVVDAGNKLNIVLPGGKTRSVREKDVVLLHPGPVSSLPDIETEYPAGQPEEAWELLQGESPSLNELADIVYGEYTPSTAWLAFRLLNRTPWFKGTPESIEVVDAKSVAERIRADREKTEAENRWLEFMERFEKKNINPIKDELFLRDLEMCALGRSKGSRILKTLGKIQSPENAHRVMIAYKAKDETWNPHPLRLNLPMDTPDYPIGELPPDKRLNLTDVEAFAIDDEGTQDPDDAVAWDGEKFWVHVADVAALFPADSQEDETARERVSSLYLPEITVPMLPPQAVQCLGLGLEETSPACSYAFSFDDDFNVIDFSIHLTIVRVTRISYTEVDKRMQEEPFATMKRITDAAARRRDAAGAISIYMPKVKIRVDDGGEIHIAPLPDTPSRQLVAEAMLLTGLHVARLCRDREIPIPFAVQEAGDVSRKAKSPANSAKEVLPGSDMNRAKVCCPVAVVDYAAEFNRRRGMKRSRMTLNCAPHDGLGLDVYSRVTSPLRRYPDLIASRQIRQYILGKELENAESVLAGLTAFESQIGNLIQTERRSNLFWKLHWLKRRPGFTAEAWLIDRRERQGLFLIPAIALEIQVAMKKEVKLGGCAILKLQEVDIPELSVLFLIQDVFDS